ncbi:MAG: hypothetical protein B7733_20940 [Myxococcales bacterium FL481]|nr:MAG: hypothetical protein B7733_20940 [Myxococcales bacterium FL481]
MNLLVTGLVAMLAAFAPTSQFEELAGFRQLVTKQVSDRVGLERLAPAVGLPLEPGVYVTLSASELVAFDLLSMPLQNGRFEAPATAAECKGACPSAAYGLFRGLWSDLAVESHAVVVDFPSRVLFATEASIPASTLIEAAYAAASSRPRGVPTLHLLVYHPQAGLRARPFFLLPPGGLTVREESQVLGLVVGVEAAHRYAVDAASPSFHQPVTVSGLGNLASVVAGLKKRHPGKNVVQLDVRGPVTVGELASVMTTVERSFPTVVLSAGQRVTVQR